MSHPVEITSHDAKLKMANYTSWRIVSKNRVSHSTAREDSNTIVKYNKTARWRVLVRRTRGNFHLQNSSDS